MKGLADDKGLYMPKYWPKFSYKEISNLSGLSYSDLAFKIMRPFVGASLSSNELMSIIEKSYSTFTHSEVTPLKKISDREYLLELFHGPTLAFKDCAMQFLGCLFEHYLKKR